MQNSPLPYPHDPQLGHPGPQDQGHKVGNADIFRKCLSLGIFVKININLLVRLKFADGCRNPNWYPSIPSIIVVEDHQCFHNT